MSLQFNQTNFSNAGFNRRPRSSAPSKRSSRQAVLAGKINNILKNPVYYSRVAPIQLEKAFKNYINAKSSYKNNNKTTSRSKYYNSLGVTKNSLTANHHASQFERAKLKFLQNISNNTNLTSVLMRLNSDSDRQFQLIVKEKNKKKFAKENPQALALASAIKAAKSSYNGGYRYNIIPGIQYHNKQTIDNIKKHMLIHGMTATEINETIKKIRNQIKK
jgi:hypothetical protein